MTYKRKSNKPPAAAWTALLQAAKEVLANWETGDLAKAVNQLREATELLDAGHSPSWGRTRSKAS